MEFLHFKLLLTILILFGLQVFVIKEFSKTFGSYWWEAPLNILTLLYIPAFFLTFLHYIWFVL